MCSTPYRLPTSARERQWVTGESLSVRPTADRYGQPSQVGPRPLSSVWHLPLPTRALLLAMPYCTPRMEEQAGQPRRAGHHTSSTVSTLWTRRSDGLLEEL